MGHEFSIRPAAASEAEIVSDILLEAHRWLEQTGRGYLFRRRFGAGSHRRGHGRVFPGGKRSRFRRDISSSTIDHVFWPDFPDDDSVYLHRLAIRRKFARSGLSQTILAWAVGWTRSLGRKQLRLDCLSERAPLQALYQNFGFKHHSDRQVGPFVASQYEYKIES